MELQTISQVSKRFKVTTRTLRYYEQIGLLQSIKKEDYSYRVYDETSILRLQQILVLRKLRIPLKEIEVILNSDSIIQILEVFSRNFNEINDEIIAMSTIRSILSTFIERISENSSLDIKKNLMDDHNLLDMVNSLTVSKINFKEDKSMEDLNKASEKISKIRNMRIVYLPPATVASYNYIGESPEDYVSDIIDAFVKDNNLEKIKPDLRHYGFNNPSPTVAIDYYGYEMWVTIPDDMEVKEPLIKKKFAGGFYGAHCIEMGNFDEWQLVFDWIDKSDDYEYDIREPYGMSGLLEEKLCYFENFLNNSGKARLQLDLLIPIKKKS